MSLKKRIFGVILILIAFLWFFVVVLSSYFDMSDRRVEFNQDVNLTFISDSNPKVILLYFGYVGCETVCTPNLQELSKIYSNFDSRDIKLYFINLTPDSESYIVDSFAKYFHKDFKGILLDTKELLKLESIFRLNLISFSKYSLNHSGFLYLLIPKASTTFELKYIYVTKPFDERLILDDIKNLL